MENGSGKGLFYGVIGVATLVVAIIGATFAWFSATASQDTGGTTVHSGTLTISYDDGTIVAANNLKPAVAPASDATCAADGSDNVCYKNNFSVGNTGTLDAKISGVLTVTTNGFEAGQLMYAVYDGANAITAPTAVPATGTADLFSGLTLTPAAGTKEYTLFIWLATTATNASQNQTMTGTINLSGSQTNATPA